MKTIIRVALATIVLLSGTTASFAQHRDDERGNERRGDDHRRQEDRYQSVEEHGGWRRGQQMRRDDWDRGRRFDYRGYGLNAPPPGYEWREVGGAFILGAIATGIIANILLQPPQ